MAFLRLGLSESTGRKAYETTCTEETAISPFPILRQLVTESTLLHNQLLYGHLHP